MNIARVTVLASIGLAIGLTACAEAEGASETAETAETASAQDVSIPIANANEVPALTPVAAQASMEPVRFSGEVSMNGSVENGEFVAALDDALGDEIVLDVQFSYFAGPGSFDVTDACEEKLDIPRQPDTRGIDRKEYVMVVPDSGDMWDYAPSDIGSTVTCDTTVTFQFSGKRPALIGQGTGVGYYAIEGTFEVTGGQQDGRNRFILRQK